MVLIDDHPLVLQGLQSIIAQRDDMEIVGAYTSGEQALRQVAEVRPDVLVVDMRIPGEYGLEIIKCCRERVPGARCIILTSFADAGDARRALAAGVDGYILKEAPPEEIIRAIRQVYRGSTWFDTRVLEVANSPEPQDPFEQLTNREKEVLVALAQGKSNRDIAAEMYITEYTVKKHVSQILDKLGVADRTQAALFAVSHGLAP